MLRLWDLASSHALSSPSKPWKKRELDGSPKADEMDVDHVRASAVRSFSFAARSYLH